jgi:hypothetical protein
MNLNMTTETDTTIELLVDNSFTFTHLFAVFCRVKCFGPCAIIRLTYMFLNYCTAVLVQIYIYVF